MCLGSLTDDGKELELNSASGVWYLLSETASIGYRGCFILRSVVPVETWLALFGFAVCLKAYPDTNLPASKATGEGARSTLSSSGTIFRLWKTDGNNWRDDLDFG